MGKMATSNEEALTGMVIDLLRTRMPEILRNRNKATGRKIVINMPPGQIASVDIEFPPDIVRVSACAQRA